MMKKLGFCLYLLLLPLTGIAQETTYKTARGVPYELLDGSGDPAYTAARCVVDVHYPENKKNVPVIVYFHGGGLTMGQREIPDALKEKGYVIVGVGYRLSPKVKAETSVGDAVAAVAWTFKNIAKYNGDPYAIFVSGHSAGGYLALMTVMDKSKLQKFGIDANNIAGLIPFSGHTITHFTIRKERGIPGGQPVIDKWAPLYYVRGDAPPILLVTGDRNKEMLGRYEENAYFYRMMKVNGQKDITQYEMQGYGHNMTYPAFPLLLDFMADHFKN